MILMKFGGTSVKDKNAIERVISIVRGRMADKPLVVVSALAKVTRVLCGIAEEAEAQHFKEVDELLDSLRDRHTSLAAELLSGDSEYLRFRSECRPGFAHGFRPWRLPDRRTFAAQLCPHRLHRRSSLLQDCSCRNECLRTELPLAGRAENDCDGLQLHVCGS